MFQPEDSPSINEDIQVRKEFRMLKSSIQNNIIKNPYIELYDSNKWIKKNMYTMLKSYQMFVGNFFNPSTPYTRLLLKWETGVGKTIGSLRIAMDYIRIYNELSENVEFTGSVFVIGFTEDVFKRELMRFTQFGFINEKELQQMNFLKGKGMAGNASAAEQYKELYSKLKRRLISRKKNGFFKFYGYKALTNKIFVSKINITNLSREEIITKMNTGEIKLNTTFMDEFANSIIICDEIHRLYNSIEKNNWGITIETVLNYNPSCRALFLSATPLNNSPTEIVDLLNLLLPREKYPLVQTSDLFDKSNNLTKAGAAKLESFLKGRISFVRDVNPERFASKEVVGETIPGIGMLKFIRCEMSPFHYKTYKEVHTGTMAVDGIYLNDICLPDPTKNSPFSSIGLYKTSDIRSLYQESSVEWKKKHQIYMNDNEIVGEALSLEADLPKISTKYTKMVRALITGLEEAKGKTFVYHNSKQISGVFFIEEVLRENGFVGIDDNPNDSTLCVLCGAKKKNHSAKQLVTSVRGGGNIEERQQKNHVEVLINQKKIVDYSYENGKYIFHFEDVGPEFYNLSEDEKSELAKYIIGLGDFEARVLSSAFLEDPDLEDPFGAADFFKRLGFTDTYTQDMYIYFRKSIVQVGIIQGGKSASFDARSKSDNLPIMRSIKISDDHTFQAARLITLHGEMDKKEVNILIEKFNKPSNTDGSSISVLIASRFLKESYTLVAVRNIMVMSRPDNISILLQIIGRAVRDRVHDLVHPSQRHVIISLFVSSMPGLKGLSYEEIKYKEKVNSNKIVRQIERIMHTSAIDGLINKEMIWQKKGDQLDIEPYESSIRMSSKEPIKESSFWAYYATSEVEYLKFMIKTCFISYSPVWKYIDLFKTIKDPPFPTTIDPNFISQELFNVALDLLMFKTDHKKFKPIFMDNEIITIDGSYYTIVHYDSYYMLANYDIENKDILLDIESFSRHAYKSAQNHFSLKEYVIYDAKNNYANKKERFISQWVAVDFKNIKNAIYSFGSAFHAKFIEDAIAYTYNYYIHDKKDANWPFYVKIVQYYSLFGLIAFAGSTKPPIAAKFKKLNLMTKSMETAASPIRERIATSSPNWITTGFIKKYEEMNAFKKGTAVKGELLPIGHFLGKIPQFYIDEKWTACSEYSSTSEFAENDIIIGYEERQEEFMNIKFKIRSPIQMIKKHNDLRLIERGTNCITKNKEDLVSICKKLSITTSKKDSTRDLCDRIKSEMMHREAKARESGSMIKWFYMFYENKPIV